jgi:hypothetical protein
MMRSALVVGMLGLLVACEPEAPCDRYVDYMCDCHDGEDGVSCGDLEATYLGAGPAIQDECAVLLDEQEAQDQDEGVECPL